MKIEITPETKDKIQIEKKQFENSETFIQRIIPHKNHTVFEFNITTKKLTEAKFSNIPTIKWEDAVKENYSIYRKILKTENCVYFSALNRKNAYKILNRDFGLE